jgi:hypothetical protein
MGIETALIAGAAAGGLGGAVKGAKGTPDQVATQEQKTSSTSSTSIAPQTSQEKALQSESLGNYMQAGNMAGQIEQQMAGTQSYQDMARQAGQNILSGQAMQLTPQEQQQIQDLRSSLINQGQLGINQQVEEGIQRAQMDAANRGLRGQAMGALQGQVMQGGARALGDITAQANTQAAQAAMTMPYQRIGAQQGVISQGMSLADQLRQQAMQNRMSLQDPALMSYLQRERMAQQTTSNTSNMSGTQTTPGQQGGFWNAVSGGLAGAGQGMNLGGNIMNAWNAFPSSNTGGGGGVYRGANLSSNRDMLLAGS